MIICLRDDVIIVTSSNIYKMNWTCVVVNRILNWAYWPLSLVIDLSLNQFDSDWAIIMKD